MSRRVTSYPYYGTLRSSDLGDLVNMIDEEKLIVYRTFREHVNLDDFLELQVLLGYQLNPKKGITIKEDPQVKYFKSSYRAASCYYVRVRGIEFVFLDKELMDFKAHYAGQSESLNIPKLALPFAVGLRGKAYIGEFRNWVEIPLRR